MPADPPLTPDERKVLAVLMEPNRRIADRQTEKVAEAVGWDRHPTWLILRGLETRQPQLAHPEVDEGLGIEFWRTTYEATEAYED